MVMYAGQAVEYATCDQIFEKPLHPYTIGLLNSIPKLNEEVEKLYTIRGSVPNATKFPRGCRFADRCEYCTERCVAEAPQLYNTGNGRCVRCFLYDKGGEA